MFHRVTDYKQGNFSVSVTKPHGFGNEFWIRLDHPFTWSMFDIKGPRERIKRSVAKEIQKLRRELRLKKIRMIRCRC